MRRFGIALAVAAIALAVAASASALIVPQRSIAGVRLGQTKAQVRATLGAPTRVKRVTNDFGLFVEFVYPQVHVGFQGNRTVTTVWTTSRRERTSRGIGVGSTVAQVQARLPGVRCLREQDFHHCLIGRLEPGRTVTDLRIGRGRVSMVEIAYVID